METRNSSMSKEKWQKKRENKRNTAREMEMLITGEAGWPENTRMKKGAPEPSSLGPEKDR